MLTIKSLLISFIAGLVATYCGPIINVSESGTPVVTFTLEASELERFGARSDPDESFRRFVLDKLIMETGNILFLFGKLLQGEDEAKMPTAEDSLDLTVTKTSLSDLKFKPISSLPKAYHTRPGQMRFLHKLVFLPGLGHVAYGCAFGDGESSNLELGMPLVEILFETESEPKPKKESEGEGLFDDDFEPEEEGTELSRLDLACSWWNTRCAGLPFNEKSLHFLYLIRPELVKLHDELAKKNSYHRSSDLSRILEITCFIKEFNFSPDQVSLAADLYSKFLIDRRNGHTARVDQHIFQDLSSNLTADLSQDPKNPEPFHGKFGYVVTLPGFARMLFTAKPHPYEGNSCHLVLSFRDEKDEDELLFLTPYFTHISFETGSGEFLPPLRAIDKDLSADELQNLTEKDASFQSLPFTEENYSVLLGVKDVIEALLTEKGHSFTEGVFQVMCVLMKDQTLMHPAGPHKWKLAADLLRKLPSNF